MSRQNKAAAKAKLANPQAMPRKHTKQFWRTTKGTMITRRDCSNSIHRSK